MGRSHLRSPYSTKKPSFGFTLYLHIETRSSIEYGAETEFNFFPGFTSRKPKLKWSLMRSAYYNTDRQNSNLYIPTAGNTSISGLPKLGKLISPTTASPSSIQTSTPFQLTNPTRLEERSHSQIEPENTKRPDKIYPNLPITGEVLTRPESLAQRKKLEPVPRNQSTFVPGT